MRFDENPYAKPRGELEERERQEGGEGPGFLNILDLMEGAARTRILQGEDNHRKIPVGARVGALVEANEESGVQFLGYGTYRGLRLPPREICHMGVPWRLEHGDVKIPRIVLDNGDTIWGCEVHWATENEMRELIRFYERERKLRVHAVDMPTKRAEHNAQRDADLPKLAPGQLRCVNCLWKPATRVVSFGLFMMENAANKEDDDRVVFQATANQIPLCEESYQGMLKRTTGLVEHTERLQAKAERLRGWGW